MGFGRAGWTHTTGLGSTGTGGVGQSGTTQTGESPRSAPLTLGSDLGAVPVTEVEWQKQREQRATAARGAAGAARYLRVDLLVDGALRLLLLLHSQQIHQGPDGHALGRGRWGYISAQGKWWEWDGLSKAKPLLVSLCSVLGTWDSDRVRDGGWGWAPHSAHGMKSPFSP